MFTLSTLRRASTAVRAQMFVRRKRSLRKRRATVFGRRPEQTSGMCKWLCASPFFYGLRSAGLRHGTGPPPVLSLYPLLQCVRLFREATQLKTVGTVAHVAGSEALRVEVQEHAASPAKGGRPTEPVVADVVQRARRVVAEARGGAQFGVEAGSFKAEAGSRTPSGRVDSERHRN